jgi:hypothetical protein
LGCFFGNEGNFPKALSDFLSGSSKNLIKVYFLRGIKVSGLEGRFTIWDWTPRISTGLNLLSDHARVNISHRMEQHVAPVNGYGSHLQDQRREGVIFIEAYFPFNSLTFIKSKENIFVQVV